MRKMQVRSLAELVTIATRLQLICPPKPASARSQ
jgi:hypothetical protein